MVKRLGRQELNYFGKVVASVGIIYRCHANVVSLAQVISVCTVKGISNLFLKCIDIVLCQGFVGQFKEVAWMGKV